jgi:transposase-like protein
MTMNRVQFQPGLSLEQFLARYGTVEQCEGALEQARWPDGFVCPSCSQRRHSVVRHGTVKTFQCSACRRQTTLTSGTIFHASKLPLTKWLLAMYLLTQSKNNVAALELMRILGVCYRTAWRLKHKILEMMRECEASRQLTGTVVLDDAYLGGRCPGKRGRGSANKVPFIAAVQTNQEGHPQHVLFSRVKSFSRSDVKDWASRHLTKGSHVISDGLDCFTAVTSCEVSHEREVVGTSRKSSDMACFKWINIVLGNLKTSTSGTYHAFKFAKYGARYLAEAQYRFNRRFNLARMVHDLLATAATTFRCPERRLRTVAEDQR